MGSLARAGSEALPGSGRPSVGGLFRQPDGTPFFPEPKIFGSADGWPAEG